MLLSVALFQGFRGRFASSWLSNCIGFSVHLALFPGAFDPAQASLEAISKGKCCTPHTASGLAARTGIEPVFQP